MNITKFEDFGNLVRISSNDGKCALGKEIDNEFYRLTPFVSNIEHSYDKNIFKVVDKVGNGTLTYYINREKLENMENILIQGTIKSNDEYRKVKIRFSSEEDEYSFESYDKFIEHLTNHPSIYEQFIYEVEDIDMFPTPFEDLISFKLKTGNKIALGKIDVDCIKPVTPFVDELRYVEEFNCYELIDNLDSGLISLHFFIDENGNVIGTAFTNDTNNMLSIEISSLDDEYLFETYYLYRNFLKESIEKSKKGISLSNRENAYKMLDLAKRRKENE